VSITPEERVRRRRSLRLHIIMALFTLLVLIAVNAMLTSAYPWWLWVLMAWMPLIAGHTAWAMGLFDRNNEGS
jgi:uncharacterized membrane protein YdbT with pleckstrin-like domain